MERSKIVAIVTGVISLLLAIAYLIIVQLLDFRGEMIPAPISHLPQEVEVVYMPTYLQATPQYPLQISKPHNWG
ncbi:MAG: hypothetical protein AB1589_16075 [Cyanobacteriota bacterium]